MTLQAVLAQILLMAVPGVDTTTYAARCWCDSLSGWPAGTGGHAAGDGLSNIENLIGSTHNDTLTGNDGDNFILGGDGADKIDGGAGIDTTSYADSDSGVTAHLAGTEGHGGYAAGDVISNVENLIGSAHNDSLRGSVE